MFVDTRNTHNKTQHHHFIQISLIIILMALSQLASAASKYVTDQFEVTMRSGTSTANSIVLLLQSGDKVNVLEEDLASQYSLVETEDGKKGYVLSRFLGEQPAARQRLTTTLQKNQQLSESIVALRDEIRQLQSNLDEQAGDNEALKAALLASETEFERVRSAAENSLTILDDNDRLNTLVETLRQEKQNLSDENDQLKDSTRMDWFIRGAGVSLIAFLLGIIITRIRWRKQDSWGSY